MMERRIRSSMKVRIVLPEDSHPINTSPEQLVRHCGDEILGHVEVTTYGKFEVELDVSFEGVFYPFNNRQLRKLAKVAISIVRTWVGSDHGQNPYNLPPTAEFQFLEETQRVFPDPIHRACNNSPCVLRIPFRFVVPWELVSARLDAPQDFHKLCPSTKQGRYFLGTSRKIYHQPMIMYLIRIKRIKTDLPVATITGSTSQREITVMPYTPPAPPLALETLQEDYRCSISKALRQHRWSRPLGWLSISGAEPPPLNVSTISPRPSTCVDLEVVFTSSSALSLDAAPREWVLVVKQHLRSRTFYSTRWLKQMPTLVAISPSLKMRESKLDAEIREYGEIIWKKQDTVSGSDAICSWKTFLKVSINARKTLLPTFANPLSARQYADVLQLSIKGLYPNIMELILPVQVIYYPIHISRLALHEDVAMENLNELPSTILGLRHNFRSLGNEERRLRQWYESPYDETPPPYDL